MCSNIKAQIAPEGYIKVNFGKPKHSLICQLRCGILGLGIEKGRHSKLPRELVNYVTST